MAVAPIGAVTKMPGSVEGCQDLHGADSPSATAPRASVGASSCA